MNVPDGKETNPFSLLMLDTLPFVTQPQLITGRLQLNAMAGLDVEGNEVAPRPQERTTRAVAASRTSPRIFSGTMPDDHSLRAPLCGRITGVMPANSSALETYLA